MESIKRDLKLAQITIGVLSDNSLKSAEVIKQLNDKINALEDEVEELTNKIIRLECK